MTETHDQVDNFDLFPDQGGFAAGFSLGLIAGAAAFFLFGTESGKKVRNQLVEEWESAKDHMIEEGVLEDSQLSLRDFLQNMVQDIFETSLPQEIMTPTKSKKSSRAQSTRKTKRGSSKFSGV